MDGDKLKTSELIVQIVSALVIGCLGIQTGFVMAWPSYNVANFVSNETVLGTPMTSLDVSLLGALPNIGGLLAMPLCGWLFNTLGRKYGTMLLSLPYIISWLIISLTNNITLILIAVTIAGVGIAGQNVSMIYLSEIAHLSIRGAMSSSTSTGFLIGGSLAHGPPDGKWLPWPMDVCNTRGITLALPTLKNLLMPFFKEPHIVVTWENFSREFVPQLERAWDEVPFVPHGILISYTMGGYLEYMKVLMAHLISSVFTTLLLSLLPESPVFLVLVGKEKEAAKALSFYRRCDVKSKEVADEIVKIKLTINPKMEKLLQEKDQDLEIEDKMMEKMEIHDGKENISAWKLLLKSKSSRHILGSLLIIISVSILAGGSALQVFAESLFAEAVPSMSANQCAIFLALNSLVASVVSMVLIDKCGRKIILIISSSVAGICTGLLGTQLQLHWAPSWFTLVLIYVYNFMYTGGCSIIPCVLASEVFLPEVRSICNSIFYAFVWIFIFINLFAFNLLVESVGLYFVFFIYCFMCVANTTYVYFSLPETKGLSVDIIQERFLKPSVVKR